MFQVNTGSAREYLNSIPDDFQEITSNCHKDVQNFGKHWKDKFTTNSTDFDNIIECYDNAFTAYASSLASLKTKMISKLEKYEAIENAASNWGGTI